MNHIEKLTITFSQLQQAIETLLAKADSLIRKRRDEIESVEELKTQKNAWVSEVETLLKSSFENPNNQFYTSFRKANSNVFRIPGAELADYQQMKNIQDHVRTMKSELVGTLEFIKVLDPIVDPDVDIEARVSFKFEEKRKFLLFKLYQLYENGVTGYASIKEILRLNGVVLKTVDEDRKLARGLDGYIETSGGQDLMAKINEEGIMEIERAFEEEDTSLAGITRKSAIPSPIINNIYNVQMAGAVGPGANSVNSNFHQTNNYSLPNDTDYGKLVSELEALKKFLHDQATSPEHYVEMLKVSQALEAAKNKEGSKVVEFIKGTGKWVADGAKDIAVNVIAEVINRQISK